MANQYKNHIVYFGDTLIDLRSDTVTAETLLEGYTAHKADGSPITGAVSFVTYYTGSGAPSANLGSDGDIYLRTS